MAVPLQPAHVPSRILVRGTNWVGDTIISLPAAKALRRMFPGSVVTFWVPAGLAPLIEAAGVADHVIAFDSSYGGPAGRALRMAARLAGGGFDLAVLLQNAFESAFTSWLARVPLRAGYSTDLRGPLLNLRVPRTREILSRHQVFYYLGITDFLRSHFLGSESPDDMAPDCSITIPPEGALQARRLLGELGVEMDRPLICLCAGSVNSEAKRWPADSFAALADLLTSRLGAQVVFAGASGERGLLDGIIDSMKTRGAVNLAGRTGPVDSMAIMNLSCVVISNDTGSAHLAVAAGSSVLTIFGPTSPGATAPHGPDARIIRCAAPCAPCRHFRCPIPHHPCMSGVTPEAVLERTEEILEQKRWKS
jgi:lipopolysaccharide heptosyltransferase II